MKILYLGDDYPQSTSAQRAEALRRLGHEIMMLNPRSFIPRHRVISGLNVRTGFRLFAPWVGQRLRSGIAGRLRAQSWAGFDLVWIDGCPELPVAFHRWLKSRCWPVICYHIDDPFGSRDRRKWDLLKQAVYLHDLTVVVREENVGEAWRLGAGQVHRVYRSYDPVAHAPLRLTEDELRGWTSEVLFVGTWMPERGPFMARLLDLGLPLAIWGDLWTKAAEWPKIRACWRGPAIYGADYVKAIQGAKLALGLLSKGNRDLHTQRSAEVPYIGGAAFVAERTVEHEQMYRDGVEVALWSSPEECAGRCLGLLRDEPRRLQMVAAARERVLALRLSNDAILRAILAPDGSHPLVSIHPRLP